MKPWIRRTLIGTLGVAALFGGLAAWAQQRHGGCWSDNAAERRACMVDFASRKLDLDATQKAKLEALAGTLQAKRAALVPDAANPRAELQALIAGPSFDRTQAAALLQAKLATVQTQSPEVINAFGDFFDSLRPDQQAQLREALARRWHRHGRHG
ncbi:MAG: Spy/CpxP family protein refolding chaperone [Rubrivivax sp.]